MKRIILSLLLVIAMLLPVFNLAVMAANEPTITSHKNGKTYAADDFYIKWNSVSGAKRYRLAVKSLNDGSYAADIWWDDKLTKTKYECDEDDIKPGHRYKIWVGACGSSHDDVISQYSIEVIAKAAECDHDDYEDYYDYSKYEQISGDNTYHNAVHYYERICEDCDETIQSNVKGNIEKEKHNFSGDKCKACGYKKTCSHSDYEDYYDYTKYEQISNDNNYHNAVSYYERVCEDCDKTIKSDVKGDIKKEAHSFSGDKCKSCGYVKKEAVCQHPNYDDYYSTTKYEQISGDNNYHNAVNYYDRECDDCGKTIKTDVKGEIKKEAHSFSGDKCKSCGYVKKETVCQHTNYDDYYSTTKYEQISGDNNYHNNGTHSCVKNCSGTTKNCSGNPCSVCGYNSYKEAEFDTEINQELYFKTLNQCVNSGKNPINNEIIVNTLKRKFSQSIDLITNEDRIIDTLHSAPTLYRDLYLYSFLDYEYAFYGGSGGSYYSPQFDAIMGFEFDPINGDKVHLANNWTKDFSVFFHETGHAIDVNALLYFNTSCATMNDLMLEEWIYADVLEVVRNTVEKYVKQNNKNISYTEQEEIAKAIIGASSLDDTFDGILEYNKREIAYGVCKMLSDELDKTEIVGNGANALMVCDIYGGMTNNKVYTGWGHNSAYLTVKTNTDAKDLLIVLKNGQEITTKTYENFELSSNVSGTTRIWYASIAINVNSIKEVYSINSKGKRNKENFTMSSYWFDESGSAKKTQNSEAWAEFFAAKITNNYAVQKQNEKYLSATCLALEYLAEDMLAYYKDKYK
ncbi:MAG: hypothetical protein E7399_00625 [Ruminococcaceae bacterium]|nr:hypothetical protein [Oscillospiraceae bacterium]